MRIKTIKAVLSLLIALVTLLVAPASALGRLTDFMSYVLPANSVTAPEDTSDFVPVIRFSVASDTHLKGVYNARSGRIQKAVTLAYSDAEQDANYKKLDAVLWAGDLTDNGRKMQFVNFTASVRSALKGDTKFLAVVAKSHDGNAMDKKSLSYFSGLSGNTTDFHTVINGFHFIGLSASETVGEHYSEYQREWLKNALEEAVAEDAEKPIFVMQHEHIKDTVYGSLAEDGWGMDYFTDILEQYPQVVDFSGHSHYPLNDPRSIWQGAFTAVGTGALHYAEFTVDGENRIHPDGNKKMAQSWIVEVDKDNTVRLRGYDDLSATLFCEYMIHNPANADAREYTPEQQMDASSAPKFAEDAALAVKKASKGYKVTFPGAESTDGNPVFLYRVSVIGTADDVKSSEWYLNNYWRADTYDSITRTVKAEKGDTIQVTAENAYGMKCEPLTFVVG